MDNRNENKNKDKNVDPTPAPVSNEQQAIKDKARETRQKQPPPQELPAQNVEEHPQRRLG